MRDIEELQSQISRLRVEPKMVSSVVHVRMSCYNSIVIIQQVPLEFPLQLNWRRGPDMPFEMSNYVQSVVMEGTVYVGGGDAGFDSDNDYIVMTYDISTEKWATLPPYRTWDFAMTAINNQLVLVGGDEHGGGGKSKVIGVWDADSKQWTYPYPEMHTARAGCSAIVHNEWLVVVGGWSQGARLSSSVEVMNTHNKQWYAGPPTPLPWENMKIATVGDECYFMGGYTATSRFPTNTVYSVSLSALTTGLNSSTIKGQKIWKEISGLPTTCSTPFSISGSLLAVGGEDKDGKTVTAIHLYQLDTGEWVKVGDLPTLRRNCTCAMIKDEEIVVAGGRVAKRMDIALIK